MVDVGPLPETKLKLGDIVLFRSDGFIAWDIRRITTRRGEAPARVNHTAMVVGFGPFGEPLIMDAQPPIVSVRSLFEHYGKQVDVAVYRIKGLTDQQRSALARVCMRYSGRPYGIPKILLFRLGLEALCFWDSLPICSGTVACSAAEVLGWKFASKDPLTVSPDDIDDDVLEVRPERYEVVRPLAPAEGLR